MKQLIISLNTQYAMFAILCMAITPSWRGLKFFEGFNRCEEIDNNLDIGSAIWYIFERRSNVTTEASDVKTWVLKEEKENL